MDFIRMADWIIDLGPEGVQEAVKSGEGAPETIAKLDTATGSAIAPSSRKQNSKIF